MLYYVGTHNFRVLPDHDDEVDIEYCGEYQHCRGHGLQYLCFADLYHHHDEVYGQPARAQQAHAQPPVVHD